MNTLENLKYLYNLEEDYFFNDLKICDPETEAFEHGILVGICMSIRIAEGGLVYDPEKQRQSAS